MKKCAIFDLDLCLIDRIPSARYLVLSNGATPELIPFLSYS